jgi:hypothetical protein
MGTATSIAIGQAAPKSSAWMGKDGKGIERMARGAEGTGSREPEWGGGFRNCRKMEEAFIPLVALYRSETGMDRWGWASRPKDPKMHPSQAWLTWHGT